MLDNLYIRYVSGYTAGVCLGQTSNRQQEHVCGRHQKILKTLLISNLREIIVQPSGSSSYLIYHQTVYTTALQPHPTSTPNWLVTDLHTILMVSCSNMFLTVKSQQVWNVLFYHHNSELEFSSIITNSSIHSETPHFEHLSDHKLTPNLWILHI